MSLQLDRLGLCAVGDTVDVTRYLNTTVPPTDVKLWAIQGLPDGPLKPAVKMYFKIETQPDKSRIATRIK